MDSIINILETTQNQSISITLPQIGENRGPSLNDDDVICVDMLPIVDYIDLCSPSPRKRRPKTRGDKGRQYSEIGCKSYNEGLLESNEPQNKRAKDLTCRVCLESLMDRGVTMSTSCGHVFCKPCLDQVLQQTQKNCPLCKHPLNKKRVFRIFL